jgi:hypothetical protein
MFSHGWVAALGLLLALASPAAEPGVKTQFVGGTVSGIGLRASARLDLTGQQTLLIHCGKTELTIPYEKVNTEYGQNVTSIPRDLICPCRCSANREALRHHRLRGRPGQAAGDGDPGG